MLLWNAAEMYVASVCSTDPAAIPKCRNDELQAIN
jgi:hypothetical protein